MIPLNCIHGYGDGARRLGGATTAVAKDTPPIWIKTYGYGAKGARVRDDIWLSLLSGKGGLNDFCRPRQRFLQGYYNHN